jgi:hypothetical protein
MADKDQRSKGRKGGKAGDRKNNNRGENQEDE